MAKHKTDQRQFYVCNISENFNEQGNDHDHSEFKFLSIVLSPTQKPPFGGLMWRRVQDSNLCIAIHDDGLAIRCITTLPTLHVVRGYIYIICFKRSIAF